MRFIPTRVHGALDYLMGIVLIASPWIFDFSDGGAKMWIPIILGAGMIAYSLVTDYELGAVRALPMSTHLVLDMASAALLAASPWLFGFADEVKWPHLIIGLLELATAAMTNPRPDYDEIRIERPGMSS